MDEQVLESREAGPRGTTILGRCGLLLMTIGVAVLLWGLLMSGAPEFSDTLNIGLLNDKTNLVLTGGFIATWGVILFAGDHVARRVALRGQ